MCYSARLLKNITGLQKTQSNLTLNNQTRVTNFTNIVFKWICKPDIYAVCSGMWVCVKLVKSVFWSIQFHWVAKAFFCVTSYLLPRGADKTCQCLTLIVEPWVKFYSGHSTRKENIVQQEKVKTGDRDSHKNISWVDTNINLKFRYNSIKSTICSSPWFWVPNTTVETRPQIMFMYSLFSTALKLVLLTGSVNNANWSN